MTVVSQLLGLPMLVLCLLLLPGVATGRDLAWGAGAGLAGVLGHHRALPEPGHGAMAVAAPTTAVTGALVPLLYGLLRGERPTAGRPGRRDLRGHRDRLVSLGPAAAGGSRPRWSGWRCCAGALFGLFFILLAHSGDGSGMWPLAGGPRRVDLARAAAGVRARGLAAPAPVGAAVGGRGRRGRHRRQRALPARRAGRACSAWSRRSRRSTR